MKSFKNKIAIFLASLFILTSAMAIDTTVIDEKWGKPIYVYGSGLSEAEIIDTAKVLGIENLDNVNIKEVNGQDEIRYLGQGAGDDSAMISSVMVQKRPEDHGVKVEIKTPQNITQITAEQYENAAITAGVSNCSIIIGSVKPVTGESALTGIYKAYEANAEALDEERMKVAQQELETTNDIVQENKDKENFSIGQFNQVIINVKQEINNYVTQEGKEADLAQIRTFIEDSIVKYDLKEVVTQEQIDKLVTLFDQYQNTGAVDSAEVQEQLKTLASDLSDKASQIYQDAKDSGILDKIAQFFKDLFARFFNKE